MSVGYRSSRAHYIRGRLTKTTTMHSPFSFGRAFLLRRSCAARQWRSDCAPSFSLYLHCHEPELLACQSLFEGFVKTHFLEPIGRVAKRHVRCGVSPRSTGLAMRLFETFCWAHCLRKWPHRYRSPGARSEEQRRVEFDCGNAAFITALTDVFSTPFFGGTAIYELHNE